MSVLNLSKWNIAIGDGQPLFCIAGLNVLEDRDLAFETARHLKAVMEKLELPFVFKASFDKANRSSIKSYRGPGLEKGLAILAEVKEKFDLPIATDIHDETQAEAVAEVADLVQIPAFLCRQTDLVVAAARATHKAGGLLHVKKGQFLAPWDCRNIVSKIKEAAGADLTILCERGSSFGYNNLVVDMLAFAEMKKLGVPVTIDATHAVQLPGADPRTGGASTGGRRDGVPIIAKAAVAAGADGVFLEFHPEPDKALCDPLSCLPLAGAEELFASLKAIRAAAV
ncbi:2-dehydro-3-deoxyphosphooctonate aldolase [Parvibaculum lavamentivorans DS-1]|uniref:3-deoxy-8-phosphooctulonate synthase n=1 Tax=Parvibaculum lavamentivorans (strain DS-1 / DSM 13023 / NCIMB 13966) TaxID=402881 RepID=A7HXZ8_PARL1|nr:3-deoxy-8-phosphooctulonate synthase [Parvibaculum lavamentivorans]ABS64781.1 2-dehydro-3-deoxyphosphooctonate aldolase [Parvibaculum lavamentivorans DS-1]